MSDSVQPHRWQPIRLCCPWDSPGRNTGVGCHFLLQCRKVKSESEVAQSCPTLPDPMDCSLPGSSIHGIFQARVLEWVATHTWCQFPGDQPWISKAIHHYVGIAVEILMLPRLWLPSIYVLGEQMQEWNNWLRQLVMCKVSLSWCNLWCIAPRSLEHAAAFTPPALKFLIVFSICIATI